MKNPTITKLIDYGVIKNEQVAAYYDEIKKALYLALDGEVYDERVFCCPQCKHSTLETYAKDGGVNNLNDYKKNTWYCKYCYTYFNENGEQINVT